MARNKQPIIALAIALLLGAVDCAKVEAKAHRMTRSAVNPDGGIFTDDTPNEDKGVRPGEEEEEEDDSVDADSAVNEEFGLDPSEDLSQMVPPEPAVLAAQEALVRTGSKGAIEWSDKSKAPCRLAGKLTYEDMVMKFDISDTGIVFKKADGSVPFGAEKKDDQSAAVTIEGATFVHHTDAQGQKSLIHMGAHHEHFHNITSSSIAKALLEADSAKLHTSMQLLRAKERELYKDEYDNAIIELATAFAAQKVSGVSHPCSFNLFNIYTKMQVNSEVIDEETKGEMNKVEILDDETDPSTLVEVNANVSIAKSESQWWHRRRRRSRRRSEKRCPYNHCGNGKFGRCGDGWGLGCIWIWCLNCKCNQGCENHDKKCHCDGGCPVEDYGMLDLLRNRCSQCHSNAARGCR